MDATLERESMTKKPGRPKLSQRNDVAVKVDKAVVAMAKLIAARRGIPLAELLSESLRAPIERSYAAMLRELEKP